MAPLRGAIIAATCAGVVGAVGVPYTDAGELIDTLGVARGSPRIPKVGLSAGKPMVLGDVPILVGPNPGDDPRPPGPNPRCNCLFSAMIAAGFNDGGPSGEVVTGLTGAA